MEAGRRICARVAAGGGPAAALIGALTDTQADALTDALVHSLLHRDPESGRPELSPRNPHWTALSPDLQRRCREAADEWISLDRADLWNRLAEVTAPPVPVPEALAALRLALEVTGRPRRLQIERDLFSAHWPEASRAECVRDLWGLRTVSEMCSYMSSFYVFKFGDPPFAAGAEVVLGVARERWPECIGEPPAAGPGSEVRGG